MIDADGVLKKVFSHRAYIPFVTCGDPDIETTEKLVRAMAAAVCRPSPRRGGRGR